MGLRFPSSIFEYTAWLTKLRRFSAPAAAARAATTTPTFARKICGTPGSSQVFCKRIAGQMTSAVDSSSAPSGMSAMRRCPSVHLSP
jgi:hypothetical protein